MYYGGARSRVWCALVLGGTLAIWGALEAALVFALRVRGPLLRGLPINSTVLAFV
jgi:hypothetical protein